MSTLDTMASQAAGVRQWWAALSDRRRAGLAVLALAVVYGVTVFGALPEEVFFSGDLGMKQVLAASMARSGRLFRIAYEYPARDIDPDYRFFPFEWLRVVEGRPAPGYVTVHMFSNALLYRLFGTRGLHLVPLLSGLIVAWLAYRLCSEMDISQPWVATLLVGLCTPMLFYSLTMWEHAFAVCCAMLALYLMARQASAHRGWEAALAGVAVGLGVWSRREMALFPIAFVLSYVYVLRGKRRSWRALIPCAAGFGIILTLLLMNQHAVYGNAGTGVVAARTASVRAVSDTETGRLDALRTLLINQASLVLHHTVDGSAFWTERVLLALSFVGVILSYRLPRLRCRPVWVMSSTLLLAIGVGLAFGHSRLSMVVGLVPTLPLSAVGLVYPPATQDESVKSRRLTFDLLMTVNVAFLGLGLLLVTHAPGYCWGPRFLAVLFPLMAILAWRTFRTLESTIRGRARVGLRGSFTLLVAVSLAVQCVGVVQLYLHEQEMLHLYTATRALDVQYVVSDTRNYLEEMGGLYFEKTLLRAETQEDYDALVTMLYQNGVVRFAWIPDNGDVEPTVATAEWMVRQVDDLLYEIAPIP